MNSSVTDLRQLFPASEVHTVPAKIAEEIASGECVIWLGGPARWGLFRITPFALVLIGAYGFFAYLGSGSELSAGQMLTMLAASQTGLKAFMLPALGAGYVVALGLALRDPRQRWVYVVTDHRLITFHKGKKLREAGTERLNKLCSLKGLEGRLRGTGDVVWAQIRKQRSSEGRGPDHGLHGFRGMSQPDQWKARLLAWRDALRDLAGKDAGAFAERAAEPNRRATSGRHARRIKNRDFGFAMTLPEHWVGRIGVQKSEPLSILGLKMPFKKLQKSSDEPLHRAPETWNFVTVSGRSGMNLKVNIKKGRPVAAFETSRDKVGKSLIEADGNYRCGPLSGYRVDYFFLDKMHCRFAILAGDGFHVLINVTLPINQAEHLLPAIDTVFDSIRTA